MRWLGAATLADAPAAPCPARSTVVTCDCGVPAAAAPGVPPAAPAAPATGLRDSTGAAVGSSSWVVSQPASTSISAASGVASRRVHRVCCFMVGLL